MTNTYLLTPTKKQNKLPLAEFLLYVFFIYYYIMPSAFNDVPLIISLGIGFLYVTYVLFFTHTNKRVSEIIMSFLGCIIFVTFCYYLLTETKTIDTSVSNYDLKRFLSKFQQLFFTFLPVLFTYRVLKHGDKKQTKILLTISALFILYVVFKTFNELSANDSATRVWTDFSSLSAKNIGTYNFVYAVSVSIPVAFALFLNTNKPKEKTGLFIYVAIGFVFLIMASYTLSLLISAILCYLALFLNTKTKFIKSVALIITPLILILLPTLLDFTATYIVPRESMAKRITEVSKYFSGEAMGYNLNGRITLYRDTLKAFFQSPIIGNSSLHFDGHATFLTVLSDIGLLGSVPFYWLYFSSHKKIGNILGVKSQKRCFLIAFLSVFLTGCVNPIHSALPLPMVAWFIVPLATKIFIKKEAITLNNER